MPNKVVFARDGELYEITLWDVKTNPDGSVTGTLVSDEFPGQEESVTISYENYIGMY